MNAVYKKILLIETINAILENKYLYLLLPSSSDCKKKKEKKKKKRMQTSRTSYRTCGTGQFVWVRNQFISLHKFNIK